MLSGRFGSPARFEANGRPEPRAWLCVIDAPGPSAAICRTIYGESMNSPDIYFRNNVASTLNLLDVMVEHDVRDIVFSSTCAVYGVPLEIPISERNPRDPTNPYGESKRIVEAMLRWYDQAYDLRFVALRYFNAAGADPDGDIGEDHDPETHLVPRAIQSAFVQRQNLEIFGTDYPTPDGTAIRDYVHVSDLADGHVLALRYLQTGGTSTAFNLGTGRGYSVREVVRAVERVSGVTSLGHNSPRRPGDPPELVAEAKKAAMFLGWKARRSDLDTIVGSAFTWHRSHLPMSEQQLRLSSVEPVPDQLIAQ